MSRTNQNIDAASHQCWRLVCEQRARKALSMPVLGVWVEHLLAGICDQPGDQISMGFVKLDRPQPFCVVAIAGADGRVRHIGSVLADGRQFLHIHPVCGVHVDDIAQYTDRIVGFYEFTSHPDQYRR